MLIVKQMCILAVDMHALKHLYFSYDSAIYNFNDNGEHRISLDIGDTVQILEETDGTNICLR